MKRNCFILFTLLLCMLLSSCRSVYIGPNEISERESEVISGEYFTDGSLYSFGDSYFGYFYEGCWIYVETQRTIGPRGYYSGGVEGEPRVIYGEVDMQRIVKYNPVTGVVSSPCLNPSCNHSFESGCLMLAQVHANESRPKLVIQKIIGDWMIFYLQQRDDEYITRFTTIIYNLKTGESRSICEENLGSDVMTRWIGGSTFDGKFYSIKQILDYSETDYNRGEEGKNVLDYIPKTQQILCEYDVETGTMTELFEIPETYSLTAVSSQRFFFCDDTDNIYYCYRDGSNMSPERYLDFMPENLVGTYAYSFNELDGFVFYDLKTNEKESVLVDYDEYKYCVLGEEGVLFDHVSSWGEYQLLLDNQKNIYSEYKKTMSSDEAWNLIEKEQKSTLYNGKSQIYMSNFDGKNMRLIYEEDNAIIRSIYASGDFVFADRNTLNPDYTINSGKCVINIKTGKITELPSLEIFVPDWYVNQ